MISYKDYCFYTMHEALLQIQADFNIQCRDVVISIETVDRNDMITIRVWFKARG